MPKQLTHITQIPTFYLRDTDSVLKISENLKNIQNSLAIVGSGAICFDLVYEFKKNCVVDQIYWFYQPEKTENKYFDAVALEFLLNSNSLVHFDEDGNPLLDSADHPSNREGKNSDLNMNKKCQIFTRKPEKLNAPGSKISVGGTEWKTLFRFESQSCSTKLNLITEPVTDQLLKKFSCEIACIAIGVEENIPNFFDLSTSEKSQNLVQKLEVDINMQVKNLKNVYAAGDCCLLNWPQEDRPYFYQMQLWSQAKLLGQWAATNMIQHQEYLDFAFNTFAHVSNFFGFRIIYLGLYRENTNVKFLYRITENLEYVKVIIRNGKVIGAVLIGDTEMEEVFENLIQNELDISMLEDDLLRSL